MNATDPDDDLAEDPGSEDRSFIRDAFGLVCLLGVFLVFLAVLIPPLSSLILRTL
jgi:hypothetical protein